MIGRAYLLVIMIPTYERGDGARGFEPLWRQDLARHLDSLADLTLAAPRRGAPPDDSYGPVVTGPGQGRLSFVDLPRCETTRSALASLPVGLVRLWRAVGRAEVVHVNAAGWPFSYGWFAAPMARLRGKFVLTVIESAPWRLSGGGWTSAVRGSVSEAMARLCVNLAHLAVFTHEGYRDTLIVPSRRDRGHVIPASWVGEGDVLSRPEAERLWDDRLADPSRPLRVAFAASLREAKGVRVFHDALKSLDARGVRVSATLYGTGPLRDEAADLARSLNVAGLTVAGTVPYGPEFFEGLRGHDVLVSANLSDEQPRVVYDAFAQALPVIASDTPGHRQCVDDGRTGRVVPAGDAAALAGAIEQAGGDRAALRDLGLAARDEVAGRTHEAMHARRAGLLREALEAFDVSRRPRPAAAAVGGPGGDVSP